MPSKACMVAGRGWAGIARWGGAWWLLRLWEWANGHSDFRAQKSWGERHLPFSLLEAPSPSSPPCWRWRIPLWRRLPWGKLSPPGLTHPEPPTRGSCIPGGQLHSNLGTSSILKSDPIRSILTLLEEWREERKERKRITLNELHLLAVWPWSG